MSQNGVLKMVIILNFTTIKKKYLSPKKGQSNTDLKIKKKKKKKRAR